MEGDGIISAWGVSWDDENYYLVGFDSEAGRLSTTVDKMLHVELSGEAREGKSISAGWTWRIMQKRVSVCSGGRKNR